jgi:hypothetical protein
VTRAHPTPILNLPLDSFTAALGELDPASRALLDLSLRRGMRPEEIGDMLGTDPESVIVAREQALEQLASGLGLENVPELDGVRARLAELPADAWAVPRPTERPDRKAEESASGPGPRAKLRVATEAPRTERTQREPPRRSRRPLLLALLAVAAIVAVVVLASGGGDQETSSNTPAPAPQNSKPAPAPGAKTSAGKGVALAPVARAAGDITGTAALIDGGKRLRIAVKGLPDPGSGSYQVWLYNSVIDARGIGAARGTRLSLDLKLPPNASNYRFVDISREPSDGNANHSGESVLRVPLSKLAR